MNFRKELERQEKKYSDLILYGKLSYEEREQIIDLHDRLEGHLYDINYLVDFVRDIPSYVKFKDGPYQEDDTLALVGVASLDEFVYITFDKNNKMQLYSGCIPYNVVDKSEGGFIPNIPSYKEIKENLCTREGDQILVYKNISND